MTEKKQHSIPVPRLYKEASKILQRYENKEGSLKTLVYSVKHPNKANIMGLLSKAIQKAPGIKSALTASNIFTEEPNFNPHLAHVLTSELLEKGFLSGDCKPILVLRKYEETIRSLYDSHTKQEPNHQKDVHLPRYVRINKLVATEDDVHTQLTSEGWILQEYNHETITYDVYLRLIEALDKSSYMVDYHIPELLVFPPCTSFWNSLLYQENAIILQDKASCLPVFLSRIKPGDTIIDGCAAPGNKTSHIAAIINNTGKVLAVDKSFKRYECMSQLLQQRGVTCVSALREDFTNLSPEQHPNVSCIFLDPSCSSTGACFHGDQVSEERIQSLGSFQLQLLRHALSFPSVQEVVYSTCSVRVEENERVVEAALSTCQDRFRLSKIKKKLPGWKHFGSDEFIFGHKVLRTNPMVDKCQGFFVAKFVCRKGKKRKLDPQ